MNSHDINFGEDSDDSFNSLSDSSQFISTQLVENTFRTIKLPETEILDYLDTLIVEEGDIYDSMQHAKSAVSAFFLHRFHVVLVTSRKNVKPDADEYSIYLCCSLCSKDVVRLLCCGSKCCLAKVQHHWKCDPERVVTTTSKKMIKRQKQKLKRAGSASEPFSPISGSVVNKLRQVLATFGGDPQALLIFMRVEGVTRLFSNSTIEALFEYALLSKSMVAYPSENQHLSSNIKKVLLYLVGFSSGKAGSLQRLLKWSDSKIQKAATSLAVDFSKHYGSSLINRKLSFGMLASLLAIPPKDSGLFISVGFETQTGIMVKDNIRKPQFSVSQFPVAEAYCEVPVSDHILQSNMVLPVIALDGTHTMSRNSNIKNRWVLLTAVIMTANRKTQLLAYGISPAETREAWTFFLERFRARHPCVSVNHDRFVFMTDGDKGISEALAVVFQQNNVLLCSKHAERLLMKSCANDKSRTVKDAFWNIVHEYDIKRAYSFLKTTGADQLTRALSSLTPYCAAAQVAAKIKRYEIVTSNAAESINYQIKQQRRLDAVSLVLDLANVSLEKIQLAMDTNYAGTFTRTADSNLTLYEVWSRLFEYRVLEVTGLTSSISTQTFEVVAPADKTIKHEMKSHFCDFSAKTGNKQSYVNSRVSLMDSMLRNQTVVLKIFQGKAIRAVCSCGYFELNGIPCCHSLGCVNHSNLVMHKFSRDRYEHVKHGSEYEALVDEQFHLYYHQVFKRVHWEGYKFKTIDTAKLKKRCFELWKLNGR